MTVVTPNADVIRLMNAARMQLPGAIDDVLRVELYNMVNEWFQTTNIWTEDISFTGVVNDPTHVYTLTPVQNPVSAIVRIQSGGDANQRVVSVVAPIVGSPAYIQLVIAPTEAVTYTARVILTIDDPVDTAGYPVFPQWVLNKYQNDMLDGLLGRMMMQVGKPYSNAQMGVYHLREFNKGVAMARIEAQRRNVWRAQNWVFPQSFFRKKQQPAF